MISHSLLQQDFLQQILSCISFSKLSPLYRFKVPREFPSLNLSFLTHPTWIIESFSREKQRFHNAANIVCVTFFTESFINVYLLFFSAESRHHPYQKAKKLITEHYGGLKVCVNAIILSFNYFFHLKKIRSRAFVFNASNLIPLNSYIN